MNTRRPTCIAMAGHAWALMLVLLLALAGCGTIGTLPPTSPSAEPPGRTEPPAPDRTTPVSAQNQAQIAALTDDLIAMLTQQWLRAAATGQAGTTNDSPWDGVAAIALDAGNNAQPLWAAFPYGYSADALPFVALFTNGAAGWTEIARVDLTIAGHGAGSEDMKTDGLSPDGVEQVQIGQPGLWLQVHGNTGAHSGTYHILHFDGKQLTNVFSLLSSSTTHVSDLRDLNGDGTMEVVFDLSDYYVFCFACGVVQRQYGVAYWDGAQFRDAEFTSLPGAAPADLRALNETAIRLARAGLWKAARDTIEQALARAGSSTPDPALTWNAALIQVNAQARADQIKKGVYPLLETIFYGDYDAAVDMFRPYSLAEIFGSSSPLVAGTAAEQFESILSEQIITATTQAIAVQPDMAAAFFLRGWAEQLADPGSQAALADIAHAAALKPDEPLFSQSADYMRTHSAPAGAP